MYEVNKQIIWDEFESTDINDQNSPCLSLAIIRQEAVAFLFINFGIRFIYCNGTLALPFFISYSGIYLTLYSIDKCPTISCLKHWRIVFFNGTQTTILRQRFFFFFFWQYKYITVLTVLLRAAFKLKFCQHVSKVSLVFMHCL